MSEQTYQGDNGAPEWWLAHLDTAPAVVIRCGYRDAATPDRECRKTIGEIKPTDDGRMLAMSKREYPEAESRWLDDPQTEGLSPAVAEELAAAIAERDAALLRRYDDGSRVDKRQVWPRLVGPVEYLDYVCPLHGEVEVDTADLAAYARAAIEDTPGVTKTYRAHRGVH